MDLRLCRWNGCTVPLFLFSFFFFPSEEAETKDGKPAQVWMVHSFGFMLSKQEEAQAVNEELSFFFPSFFFPFFFFFLFVFVCSDWLTKGKNAGDTSFFFLFFSPLSCRMDCV